MKICIIHNLWGRDARGGAESVLKLLVQHLQSIGHQVVIITTQAISKKTITTFSDGVKIYSLPSSYLSLPKLSQWRRLVFHIIGSFNIKAYFKVQHIIKTENPEIVWTHNLVGIGTIILRLFHKKNIRHLHNLHDIQLLHPSGLLMRGHEKLIDSFIASLYQAIQRVYLLSFSEIISPSKWLLDIHKQKGFFKNNPCQILPNPFSYNSNARQAQFDNAKQSFTFLYVGQIEQHKGIKLLIDVFTKITNQDLRLTIVGTGSLLQYVKDKNSDNRITFTGQQTPLAVAEIMERADCLVVPSLCYENFPTVIVEAISARLPVVGSNFGGIRELIFNRDFLCEPTVEELTEKLIWAFNHREKLDDLFFSTNTNIQKISVSKYCQNLKL
jgi:glycosyltransferase involved in cell wall biosynthesis